MNIDIVTKEELQELKNLILDEIRKLLAQLTISNKWIRSVEVQKMLQCSASTLQNLRINNKIPYTRLGGTIYYSLQDIERILHENKHMPGINTGKNGKQKTIYPNKD